MNSLPLLSGFLPDLADIALEQRRAMLDAACEIETCYRVLRKGGLNVVGEVLRVGGGDLAAKGVAHHEGRFVVEGDTQR